MHRWCRLLEEHGIPADPDDLDLDPPPGVGSPAPGATVIHPGAASEARRWPAGRCGGGRARRGRRARVVITGGAGRARSWPNASREPADEAPRVLAGETDLLSLAAPIADARLLLCGDTGVAHLATAFGTPSVVLFGPTPPARVGPARQPRATPRVVGRRERAIRTLPCRIAACCSITPEDVLRALPEHPVGSPSP